MTYVVFNNALAVMDDVWRHDVTDAWHHKRHPPSPKCQKPHSGWSRWVVRSHTHSFIARQLHVRCCLISVHSKMKLAIAHIIIQIEALKQNDTFALIVISTGRYPIIPCLLSVCFDDAMHGRYVSFYVHWKKSTLEPFFFTKTVPKWGPSCTCGHENGCTLEPFRLHFFLSV